MVEPTPYYTHRCLECQLMRCTRENDVCLECQNNKANPPPEPKPVSFEELQSWDYWGGFTFCRCLPSLDPFEVILEFDDGKGEEG